jgi:WD40 repeat protein
MLKQSVWLVAVIFAALGTSLFAQEKVPVCGPPPSISPTAQPNIFSEQQEVWLGKLESDLVEADIRPVKDPALNAHLQGIVDRLASTLPPTTIKFRVILVDSDQINGFSLAGGHIYILRKLAAVAKNDDELAGVLGHEMGHIVSHVFAFEATRELKRLTNVTSFSDEADLRRKYGAMLDAEFRDKHPQLSETDADQAQADQIGLYAMAAAGYRPQAYAEIWDRVFFVEGKTGSRFGDLIGLTKPSQKRLRSISAMIAALPKGCGSTLAPDQAVFSQWHNAVVANQAPAVLIKSASLTEVVLSPTLHMDVENVKFSPNGKFLLAQDQSSIYVLDREPFALRFRIDADGALPAAFSPDSQSVSFATLGLHVEQWSVAEKRLLSAREMLTRKSCYDPRLSGDARTLVCVEPDPESGNFGLAMLDTSTSEVLWEKKNWLTPSYGLAINLLVAREVGDRNPFFLSSTSPDGNVLLFGGSGDKTAFDFKQRTVVKTGGNIRGEITGPYAFIGNDKIAGANNFDRASSAVYSFPEGGKIQKVSMPFANVLSVTNAGTDMQLVVTGLKDDQIGIEDFANPKSMVVLKARAADEYNGTIVAESRGGALVLGDTKNLDPKSQKYVNLPTSKLSGYTVAALSPDGKYLAVSTNHLGAIWNVATGKQLGLIHGFTDAAWTEQNTLYVDIPKEGEVERHIAQISMTEKILKNLSYKVTPEAHMRYGRLTDWKMDEKKKSWILSMYDPATDQALWSHTFPEKYFRYTSSYGGRDLIFNFELNSNSAKDALKSNATLAAEVQTVSDKKSARLIQILDGNTGAEVGSLIVELPPNFAGTDGFNRVGDTLYVEGVDGRTSVYSIATGKKDREFTGLVRALDPGTGRIFSATRLGEGVVYDPAGNELARYQVGEPIRYALFRDRATIITILTANQRVMTMQVDKPISSTLSANSTSTTQ